MNDVRDEGFDDLLDAISDGAGYFLECSNGHSSLPPRRVCPDCGDTDLSKRPLPGAGAIVTYTVVHVLTPQFEGEAPYVTAIAEFGSVRLTGLLVDIDPDAVTVGMDVSLDVETIGTTGRSPSLSSLDRSSQGSRAWWEACRRGHRTGPPKPERYRTVIRFIVTVIDVSA